MLAISSGKLQCAASTLTATFNASSGRPHMKGAEPRQTSSAKLRIVNAARSSCSSTVGQARRASIDDGELTSGSAEAATKIVACKRCVQSATFITALSLFYTRKKKRLRHKHSKRWRKFASFVMRPRRRRSLPSACLLLVATRVGLPRVK